MSELAIYGPLSPQRWGFLPTSQFWVRAWLTPISLVYWAGYILFFTLADYIQLNWWQTALGVCAFHEIWGGLLERRYRRTLARRPRPSPTAMEAVEAATVPALTERGLPAQREFSAEDWELFVSRVFGRWSGAAQKICVVALCLLFFYPGWESKILAVAWMCGSALIARSCIRRWRREASQRTRPALGGSHEPRPASPALQSVAQPPDLQGHPVNNRL